MGVVSDIFMKSFAFYTENRSPVPNKTTSKGKGYYRMTISFHKRRVVLNAVGALTPFERFSNFPLMSVSHMSQRATVHW